MSNLPAVPSDEERRHYNLVNQARFSSGPGDEVIARPYRWYHRRWLLALVIILFIAGAVALWQAIRVYPEWRVSAILLGLFWLFAIGIHPLHAAGRTIGSWFDHDD